jgi:ArsR family transcriptional regulator, arsenate/arsenite/antimonite-responsive transcriptional repressor
MRELIKTFKALSDETRLRILNIVTERECCVCEVMQALDISETRASRNLSALCDAGFLKVRRNGLWVLYSIDKENNSIEYQNLVEIVRKSLDNSSTAKLDIQRLQSAERVGPDRVCHAKNPVNQLT